MKPLTKKAIMVWPNAESKIQPPEMLSEREAFIQLMVNQEKTDGIRQELSDTITQRNWVDEAAALEWKAWLEDANARYSAGLISVTIEDL